MENKYDDPQFFARYSLMPRSVEGLRGAGEWHALKNMLPDFAGKRVLDLGCGLGWHCAYAAQHGAKTVVGIDLSEKMLARAREQNAAPNVTYVRMPIEEINYPAESFDVVLSSLAFHYIQSFDAVCAKVDACLIHGGDFVFSVEHPVFTAQGKQDWYYGGGEKLHWPVDRYFEEGQRSSVFLGEEVTKYHRTLTSYMQALLRRGFAVTGLVEPEPAEELLRTVPEMADELRRPMMLLISANKQ